MVVTTPGGNNAPNTLYTYVGVTIVVSPGTDIQAAEALTTSRQFAASGGVGPYTYSTTSTLPAGLVLTAGGLLSGRPTANSAGSYNVTIRATDANGSLGFVSFTITVGARPDPTKDTSVIGIQNSQLAASKRFSGMQSDAALARLDGSRACLKNTLNITPQGALVPTNAPTAGTPVAPGAGGNNLLASNAMTSVPQEPKEGNETICGDWAAWGSAGIDYGSNGDNHYRFNMPSATLGIDYRANAALVVGVAFGYGTDRSKINDGLARSNSRFWSGMAYGGLKLTDILFLDAVVGYSDGQFDTTRNIVDEGLTFKGNRSGKQFFGKARLSGTQEVSTFKVMPFASVEYGSGSLNGYTETGDAMLALAYDKGHFDYTTAAAGIKVSRVVKADNGIFEPSIRFQQRYTGNSNVNQTLYYADLPATKYNLYTDPFSRNQSAADVGVVFRSKSGVSAGIGFGVLTGSQNLVERSGNVRLAVPF
mgnify:CR=1 FL=1